MNKKQKYLLVLVALLIIVGGVSLVLGPVSSLAWPLIWRLRFPRVILAILVGFGLAGSGSIFQGVLRNPLADPFILGTSSAATAGVMIAGLLGLRAYSGVYALALAFAFASIFIVYRIAQVNHRTPIQSLILSGVIVNLFFNALVFLFFSIFYRDSSSIIFYILGSLTEGNPWRIAASGSIILVALFLSWTYSRELNLLTQGEETALHLGVQVETTKKLLFVFASAMVAACVAVSGMIGFVGLIVPHILRIIFGADHRYLIPASALGGGILLTLTDTLARSLIPPLEIPVGALTALFGAPFFIYLLRQKQQAGDF